MEKIVVPGTYFETELSSTRIRISATIGVPASGVAAVACTAHGLLAGDPHTYSGVTGVTGLNSTTYYVRTVVDANNFTISTALTGTPAGTIFMEPLIALPAGGYVLGLAANIQIEYNPDNLGYINDSSSSVWRIIAAVSTNVAYMESGGPSHRLRVVGAAGTTRWSKVD